jgi:CRP/FNR family transcriptional regulator
MPTNADLLARLPLMRGLSPGELAALAPRFREDHYDRDAHIFYEGDPATRFWVVKAGQVKIVKAGESGKEVVIEVIPPGEAFGGATMLMPTQPATAQALSDPLTLSLSVEEYKQLLQDYPAVGVCVIEMLGERMRGGGGYIVILNLEALQQLSGSAPLC